MLQESEIQRIYAEIGQYSIELEADPTVMGPRYVNKQLALCRNYLNRVTKIRVDLSKHKRMLAVKIAGENTQLRVEKDQLLTTNDLVRKQSNIKDREAVANTILKERLAKIEVLNQDLLDLKTVDAAVEFVHNELIRTANEIKTQRALLEVDRHYKLGYGDETDGDTPKDQKGRPLPVDDNMEEEVLAALASLKNEEAPKTEEPLKTEAERVALAAVEEAQETSPVLEKPSDVDAETLAVMAEIDSVLPTQEVAEPVVDTPVATEVASEVNSEPVVEKIGEPKSDEPLGDLDLMSFVSGVDMLPTAEIKPPIPEPEVAPATKKKTTSKKVAATPAPTVADMEIDFQDLLAGL